MKTIRTVGIDQNQVVKKILINRSSLTQKYMSPLKKISISSPSPSKSPRHSFGLKNSQTNMLQPGQGLLNTHSEEYLSNSQPTREANCFQFDGRDKQKHIHGQQKKFVGMYGCKNIDECIEESKCPFEKDTNNSSKNSGSGSLRTEKIGSEYFEETYQSPGMKLKKLEKQKSIQKQKWLSNIEKVIEAEESIKDNRQKNELQIQMFEQIIKNLQKQEKLSNSQTFIIEAKEGRSHNENFAFPSITKSCEL